ncbi:putative diphthine methyl ester synthase [Prunus yedoensis var. nudiflora]|uniref:Putative diphthine methyl ester synthase n=1 Tax=Prunus yedoensis var. nudiflora TaxID=2094558 RepID=A0A314XPS7_PRUYE|nr:putative diphthine methyl ester synthase [Prunus yedoensis var. nudiflora]
MTSSCCSFDFCITHLAAYDEDSMCVGFARLGSEDQKIVSGKMKQLHFVDFGAPLHCLVIAGKTHPVEEEMLDIYKINKENDHGTVR